MTGRAASLESAAITTVTSKRFNNPKKGEILSLAAVPSGDGDDGEGGVSADDKCPDGYVKIGETRKGKAICSKEPITAEVTVQGSEFEPIPSKENMLLLLTRRLDLNRPPKGGAAPCRTFIEGVLKNLKINGTMEDLFKKVITDGGVGIDMRPGGNPNGISDDGDGNIGFPSLSRATTYPDKYQIQMRFVGVLIHELFHRAGKSHKDMAQAGYETLSAEEQKANPVPKSSSAKSNYFSNMVNKYCKVDVYSDAERKATMVP
jgi:hypothetical protein